MSDEERDAAQRFDDDQFELQLEFEDISPEDLRERAQAERRALDRDDQPPARRIDVSIRVWVALMRARALDERREELFTAWCEGLGVSEREVWDEVARILRNAKRANRP